MNKFVNKFLIDPYRLFFPIGFLFGILGVLVWLLFVLFGSPYPGLTHSYLMIGGFLTAFTTGFLFTAVPRFTGTFQTRFYELGFAFLTLLFLPILAFYSIAAGSACILVGHFNLLFFFLRRYYNRKSSLPSAFFFIPISLAFSAISHGLIVMNSFGWLDGVFYEIGRLFGFSGFMIGIVLGVGSKIIPIFTGHGPINLNDKWSVPAAMGLFFGSFFVQQFLSLEVGLLMRFIAICYVAIRFWSIHSLPPNRSKLSYGLWFSCWGLFFGALGSAVFPADVLQWNHLLFITGLSLMTLMISSRVILSHGGFDLAKEAQRPWIVVLIGCLILTSLLRLVLYAVPNWMPELIILSSVLWLTSIGLWWFCVWK